MEPNQLIWMERVRELLSAPKQAMILTYGCQQNTADSEKLMGMLIRMGYTMCENAQEADLILFNTCAVRENAELKVFGQVGALSHLKKQKPSLVIGLCGCMMQQQRVADEIKQKYRHVDLVFGTHALARLPELLYQTLSGRERVFDVENSDGEVTEDIPIKRSDPYRASVSIMYGCNNFCSYCIVPYVRGRERSREPKRILDEVRELIEGGTKEILLLGQNVNSYRGDPDFPALLEEICALPGEFLVRFMTSHPKDATSRLFDVMAQSEKIERHLHLPFQAGNNRILEKMNRRYTREQYLEKIAAIRERIPDITLTSDVIVGFPGETGEEFEDTLSLVSEVGFDSLFTFNYSVRPGTPAAAMGQQVPREVQQERFERLLNLQNRISLEKNQALLGKTERVLVEGPSKTDPTVMTGRTSGGKIVNFDGPASETGQFIMVRITQANTWSLCGDRINR